MASYGESVVVYYKAWDKTVDGPKTGDVANHTLRLIRDGTLATPTNSPAEVDATLVPGLYKLVLTAAEAQALSVCVDGKSATANVIIIPGWITFERLPTVNPGADGGVLCYGTSAGRANPTNGIMPSNAKQVLDNNIPTGSPNGVQPVDVMYIEHLAASATPGETQLHSGTAQGGSSTYIDLAAGASALNDFYNKATIVIDGGAGAGQFRCGGTYVGATRRFTPSEPFAVATDNTSHYVLLPGAGEPAAAVADAVWDEQDSGHQAAGSMGKRLREIRQAAGYGKEENDQAARTRKFYDLDGTTVLLTVTSSSTNNGKKIIGTPS